MVTHNSIRLFGYWSVTIAGVLLANCSSDRSSPVTAPRSSLQDQLSTGFPDSSLAVVVRDALVAQGATEESWNLHTLRELFAPSRGISDLSGMESLDSLEVLHLNDNNVSDLSPLASLFCLRVLNINANRVRDLVPLAQLARLEVVLLAYNDVSDGHVLTQLPFLQVVDATGNPLADDSGLLIELGARGVVVYTQSTESGPRDDPDSLTGEIAFESWRDGMSQSQIYIVDLATLTTRRITDGLGDYHEPQWSPDGERIVFTEHRDRMRILHIVHADGSGNRPVVPSTTGWYDSNPQWCPDGQAIIFASNRGSCQRCDTTPKCSLCLADLATGEISTLRPETSTGLFIEPALSPAGDRIAFLRPSGTVVQLLMMDLATGAEIVLDGRVVLSRPAWHPDGEHIAYVVDDFYSIGIHVISLSTGDISTIPTDDAEFSPAWSPDGRGIAYAAAHNGDTEIFVEYPVGSPPINVSGNPGVDTMPVWRPQ